MAAPQYSRCRVEHRSYSPGLRAGHGKQAQARDRRAEKITAVLRRMGFSLELAQIQHIAGDGVVGVLTLLNTW